jgi:hypothetical protein
VKIWFQNRRAKERRALKKHEDVIIKEKLESTATAFGMGYPGDPLSVAMSAGGGHPAAMMGGHASFAQQSLATSIMSGPSQLGQLCGPMKFE